MKKFLILTALCLMAFIGFANSFRGDGGHYKCEAKRTVEKTFDVSANPTLEMEGKYSDFIITTWDQPQIDFSVKITVKGDDPKKVEAKFNSIDIEFEQVGNSIIAKTMFGEYKYKSFTGVMTIKYYVKVPRDVYMDLETKYGDITIDEVRRKLNVNIKYGDFRADSLMIENSVDNYIYVQYGNVNIDYVKKFLLRLDYGEAKINKCEYVDGHLRYSKIFITDVNDAMLENKYSDSRIEKAYKARFVNTAYSDLKVSNCTNRLYAHMRYSDLSATMTSDSPNIEIDGQYSDAVLYINEGASFYYDLESSYSDIIFKGFFDKDRIGGHGTYGSGEPGSLDISTKYGDVKIYKNK